MGTSAVIDRYEEVFKIRFDEPLLAITPGQSIVFYAGDTCIGGGYIETRSNKNIS